MDAEVTLLLERLRGGDRDALADLIPVVYAHLHRIAEGHLRHERAEHTLQATSLVNEAYIRLVGLDRPDFQDRAHFFGVASRVMRQILVDHARARGAAKRGGEQVRITVADMSSAGRPESILALDDALTRLAEAEPQKAQFVEMRFFGGMSAEEIAEATGSNVHTVRRHLRVAQAWLHREIAEV